jgi:beta-lactamase regulating signal transducer with metallopeptidase domain
MAPPATITAIMLSASGNAANGLSPVSAAQSESQPLTVEIEPAINSAQTANLTASPRPWFSIRSENIAPLLPWMIAIWLLGVVCFSSRLIGGWLYTRRLRHYGTSPLEERRLHALHRLCSQLRVTRPVRLLESAMVKVPMVVGWLRPVVLLPASALTGLTAQQLEAIIAHELAHIRRHDYLINLLQAVVETLLFYHPAVWWVSRRIRQEREHCCDDLAVAVCGDALTYARALLELEQLRAAGPQLAMASNGGLLMDRIRRLVGAQSQHANRCAGWGAGVIALITVISVGAGAQILLQSSSNAERRFVSARRLEARKVGASAETTGESNRTDAGGADTGQQTGSAQEDRAAEALRPILQSASWDVLSQALQGAGDQARKKDGAAPKLVDPGFEKFAPKRAPIYGWYSDELVYQGEPGFGLVIMTPDATDKVEGKYSLRIEQPRVRPPNRGLAFLAQAVRLPSRGDASRSFDLSAQMRGQNSPVMIHVYVWDKNNFARVIAERTVSVTMEWSTATLKFDVPRGHDLFGVWFYLPRVEETQIWLDDVRLRPSEN